MGHLALSVNLPLQRNGRLINRATDQKVNNSQDPIGGKALPHATGTTSFREKKGKPKAGPGVQKEGCRGGRRGVESQGLGDYHFGYKNSVADDYKSKIQPGRGTAR